MRVTVLVSAYNDEPFLGAAIDSLLAQTFTGFELLVVDDASTDRSREVVQRYRDPRVRLLVNERNLGIGASLNRGLATIRTEYVARLDGNDLSFPQRLERQVAFLDAHPDVAAVGAQATLIDVRGRRMGELRVPVTELGMRWMRIFGSPLIQSASMFRRAVVWDELGGYVNHRFGEDFDLWCRIANAHGLANLPETLVAYRVNPRSMTGMTRHPAREGYRERKGRLIEANLRQELQSDDVPDIDAWLDVVDESPVDRPAAVRAIEQCSARFAAIHGENEEVARHQAWMLGRVLRKRPSLRLWLKMWRRHRRTALRAFPHFAVVSLFGEAPLRWRRGAR